MTARGFPIGGTAREAIGFAGAHYEDALRLCWLPVLLSLGAAWGWSRIAPAATDLPHGALWAPLAFQAVSLALVALYYGPLLRLAARGEAPDHGTAPLRLGWSPARYFVGTVLSLGGAAALTAPVTLGVRGLLSGTEAMRRAEVAAFEPGSLHGVEFVPAFDPSVIDLAQILFEVSADEAGDVPVDELGLALVPFVSASSGLSTVLGASGRSLG